MPHSAVLGPVEVPVTFAKDEAVGLLQEEGVVGAGGAGFPTYVKYRSPPHTLIVNAAESEPGYYADKLLLRDEPEAVVDVFDWMRHTFDMDVFIIGAEEVARPYMAELESLAQRLRSFSVEYFESKYKYGQERALCKVMLGMDIPPKDYPAQHGVVVNNVETILNIYRAVFEEQPVMTKFLHVYGEVKPLGVYEAPIGTLACDLLRIHGVDPADFAHCKLYDGGPVLAELAADPMGPEPVYAVSRTTNGLLVVRPDRNRPRNKWYPDPSYEHNSIDAPWAPDKIVNVENRIRRVRVPLTNPFSTTGPLQVSVGDHVARGDVLSEPASEGLSVGVHASIAGEVTQITDEYVQIER